MNRLTIREANADDIPLLYSLYERIGKKDAGYFEQVIAENKIFLASLDDNDCAFCIFNKTPRYSLYRKLNIPEIQDLNVLPAFRKRGIATALIRHCEDLARTQGYEQIGIGVGLFKDYGPAQVLYTKLGYIPDGNGVMCDYVGVTPYSSYLMDDDLTLMMIKSL